MTTLDLAIRLADAMADRDTTAMQAVLADDVVLEAPLPLGKKKGAAKAAKALAGVAKFGVRLLPPTENNGVVTAEVDSPAGRLVVQFQAEDEKLTRLEMHRS